MAKTPPALNARVAQRMDVAPGLMVLRVVADGWQLPEFKPGQFAVLGLPHSAVRCPDSDPDEEVDNGKLIRRAYSIASSSVERQYLEFYITLVKSGGLTPRLFSLQPGDGLWIGPKITGTFTLDQAPIDKHVILVATGTGLAPYMSMLRTVLAEQPDRRFVAVLGARHSWDLGYNAELLTMQRLSRNFFYLPIISRPKGEPVRWTGNVGYVTDLFKNGTVASALGSELRPDTVSVFLCGNPAMIEDMCAHLAEGGFREHSRKEPGEIYAEKYW
jgi:ferredoxin--NADP+ reductase